MDKGSTKTKGCQDRIQWVFEYIDIHLADPLSLEEVARHCHVSRFHFHRLFRAETGETLGCYLRRRRAERAMMFLLTSNRSVEEIAAAVGYRSTSAFFRAFKKIFSVAPTTFRCDHDINRSVGNDVSRVHIGGQSTVARRRHGNSLIEHSSEDGQNPFELSQQPPARSVRGGKSRR